MKQSTAMKYITQTVGWILATDLFVKDGMCIKRKVLSKQIGSGEKKSGHMAARWTYEEVATTAEDETLKSNTVLKLGIQSGDRLFVNAKTDLGIKSVWDWNT